MLIIDNNNCILLQQRDLTMPKSDDTNSEYNALFQEHEPPSVGIDDEDETYDKCDKGQSCHVFAIASAPTWEKSSEVNQAYEKIGTEKAIQRALGELPEPTPEERRRECIANMQEILKVRNQQETVLPIGEMYLCGGFREGKVTPEHMWIEDRTNGVTYDTFIDRGGIAVRQTVGVDGQEFQPGCEGDAFEGSEIFRVKVDGYTYGQLIAIAAGAEKKDPVTDKDVEPFPGGLANMPQVLEAIAKVKQTKEALDKIPEPALTVDEQRVLKNVRDEQLLKKSEKEIKEVVTRLVDPDKGHYESALAKYAEVAKQQREVARNIVSPLRVLNNEIDAINPTLITQSKTMQAATQHKDQLLNALAEIERKKDTLPEKDKLVFQQKIDDQRKTINDSFAGKKEIGDTINKVKTAAEAYLKWSNENAKGFRFSNLSHGSFGRKQAEKLLSMINNDKTPMADILKETKAIVNSSGTNKNSFTRYLHDSLEKSPEKLVGKESLTQKFKNYKEDMKRELNIMEQKEENNNRMRLN